MEYRTHGVYQNREESDILARVVALHGDGLVFFDLGDGYIHKLSILDFNQQYLEEEVERQL